MEIQKPKQFYLKCPRTIYFQNGSVRCLVDLNPDEFWVKHEYDKNGKEIGICNSNGDWNIWEFDENGREISWETSNGTWYKTRYSKNGKKTHCTTNGGGWYVEELDDKGNLLYYKDSAGFKTNKRFKRFLNTILELYRLVIKIWK